MERDDTRKRYQEISGVLSKYGFHWMWSHWGLGKILGALSSKKGDSSTESLSEPDRLRLALEELGTTFIKIGQLLSTRPDLLPDPYIQALSKLQDHAVEVPYPEIEATILSEFGHLPEDVFLTFDKTPRASASVAQVHDATLPDGTQVVVKVQRPNLESQVSHDLAILGQVARFISSHTDFVKRLDVDSLVEEFSHSLRSELDFTREGHNSERIADQFAHDNCLHVPAIFWDYSTHHILTMEAVSGIKINDFDALDAAGIDRKELAKNCAHIALVQILEHGFFHADPHPGNFFVHEDGVIALVDYGMVGRLQDKMRESLLRLIMGVTRHDAQHIVDELVTLGALHSDVNRHTLEHDLDDLMSRYEGRPMGEVSVGEIFAEITKATQKHALRLPSEFVMLIRVLALDEGMGAALDPDFNLIEFAQPDFKRFWIKSHSVKTVSKRLKEGMLDIAETSSDLPRQIARIVGMLERGEMKVTTRVNMPDEVAHTFSLAANRIAASVLIAGITIGLSVLAVVYGPAGSSGFGQFLLRAMLIVGVCIGAWFAVAFLRSSKK